VILLAAGCGLKKKSPPPSPATPKEQASADLAAIASLNSGALSYNNKSYDDVLYLVFGGTRGTDVQSYINERLHHYFSLEERQSASFEPNIIEDSSDDENSTVQTLAINIGTGYWYAGLMAGVTLTMNIGGDSLVLDSPRVGIMQINPGYMMSLDDGMGGKTPIPQLSRQATIVHEARHSDCARAPSDEELEIIQSPWAMEKYDNFSCGFLHVICSGGDYDGAAACDRDPWGAYAVGIIFIDANMNGLSGTDYAVMEYIYGDYIGRLEYNYSDLLNGKLGSPKMWSIGGWK
jgi:hypothetical protein